jgi:hypothetical protein
MQKYDLQKVL